VKEAANNTGPLSTPEAVSVRDTLGVAASLHLHWPEYLMEAGEMSLYLFCTCSFATLLQHPASPVRHFVISGIVRRALMGLAIGATVMALIMSPWGKQSGGHINPAMTFAFYRLGKTRLWDALFYGVAQFSGATSGVALATLLLRGALGDGTVRYAVTAPGVYGATVAFAAVSAENAKSNQNERADNCQCSDTFVREIAPIVLWIAIIECRHAFEGGLRRVTPRPADVSGPRSAGRTDREPV
jgi:Major intrinsic protein